MCINVEWRLWLSTHSFRTALLDVRFIYLTHIVIMHTFRAIRVARLAVHTPAVSTPSSTPLPTSGENPYSAAIEGLLHRNGTHHPKLEELAMRFLYTHSLHRLCRRLLPAQ